MRQKVQELVLKGYRLDAVEKMLQREYNIAANKAEFLARNETGIMLAEYKRVTYQEMGFDKFIWKTITDGRERELHRKLNGKIFRYDNPPVIDERTGQRGLPQEAYNCRCDAIPYRDDNLFIKTEYKDGQLQLARNSSEDVEWITVKGHHIPIRAGQTKEEAVKKFIEEQSCKTGKSIAGVKQGKPMSYRKANGGRVNPNFKKGGGYEYNCQTCVAVFEARLRGYDIEAVPYTKGNTAMENLGRKPWTAYKTRSGDYPKQITVKVTNKESCEKWLKANIKPGQRYAFGYENYSTDTGHVLEVKKGLFNSLQFYDPQSGKHLTAKEALKNVCFRKILPQGRYRFYPIVFRVDNTQINEELISEILDYK